jgi:hypothetical protein
MADMYDFEMDEREDDIEDLQSLSNAELVELTEEARENKIQSIREYYLMRETLSSKQRWCLIFWILEND